MSPRGAGAEDEAVEDAVEESGLPTGEVARRLGVSPVTVRSWERRYGIGPAQRTE
ncbi:MerR family DNA-binding transcriptional regulator, partial [Streptacidiphilus neutrinimicus]|uniref:MerR family DNA-binding transcriptional regulator n=1 Tax=Streptacidiphilus neutrinimicus TaxID=105420 RepID=UPI003F713779